MEISSPEQLSPEQMLDHHLINMIEINDLITFFNIVEDPLKNNLNFDLLYDDVHLDQ